MKINGNAIRPGMVIEHQGSLWRAVKTTHTQPGKGGAYLQVELKDIRTGTKLNERFRAAETVERAHLSQTKHQFLFADGDMYTFMNTENYGQISLNKDLIGEDQIAFLQDGMMVKIESHEGDPLGVQLPDTVTLTATEDGPVGDIDCHIHLMSLAGVLGVRAHCVPAATPYIAAPPARVAAWRDAMADDGGLRIGLAWAGRPAHPQDAQRSMDCAHLTPLAAMEGVSLYSLQKDKTTHPIAPELAAALTEDFSRLLENFAETAAIVENLDLVITVDTALAHLAGALGKPVWVLLPFAADWRWMRGRADTPWYPTMRLFRQESAGDWAGVIARLCAEGSTVW